MNITKEEILMETSNILLNIGVPSNLIGSRYLARAVVIASNNPHVKMNITKTIYPLIAIENNTKAINVERAIRHAIDISCIKQRITKLNDVFGITIFDSSRERPTNSELIALLAERIPYLIKQKSMS